MAFEGLIKSKITAEEWADLENDAWVTRHVVIHEPVEAQHLVGGDYIRASPVLVSVAMIRTMDNRKAVIFTVAADDGYYSLLSAAIVEYLYANNVIIHNKFGEYHIVSHSLPVPSPITGKLFIGFAAAVEFALQHVADKLAAQKPATTEE